jgi:hypothetical protein
LRCLFDAETAARLNAAMRVPVERCSKEHSRDDNDTTAGASALPSRSLLVRVVVLFDDKSPDNLSRHVFPFVHRFALLFAIAF